MTYVLAATALIVWIAGNVVLWSLKQPPETLALQALGMAVVGYPVLFWYVVRQQ